MQFADASHVEFWFSIVSDFVGDVLWQVCGDLPSPPVHGHHEPESVLHPHHHLLGMWICPGPGPSNSLVKITLLWPPEGEPFPLWHSLCPQIGLWWHLDQWNVPLCWWRSDLSWASCPGTGLLYVHPLGHPEDPVNGGPQESLLHLLLPLLCGWVLLWHSHDRLHGPWQQSTRRRPEDPFPVLHSIQPIAEPSCLQCKECSSEGCLPQSIAEKQDSVKQSPVLVQCIFSPSEMWLLVQENSKSPRKRHDLLKNISISMMEE